MNVFVLFEMNRNPDITSLPAGRVFLVCLILAVVSLAAYWPVLDCGFVNYDDDLYVTENQHVLKGLSLEGIKWAFLIDDHSINWHPLTWLSHMLDCELFGQRAGLHHLTNLLIHTASVMLLLWVLASMTRQLWPSAFVAAVFAIHPLHVESVAWIAERKDVFSGFFWVLTMACYLRYTRTRSRGSYLLTLFFFGLGLMAKPMLVTLPFVLLLLDFWPLNRLDRGSVRSRIAEKIPFFILSAASCVVTFIAQRAGGAVWNMESLPFTARLSNAVVSYVVYLVKMVWPVRLAVLYPLRPIPPWQSISALVALMAVTMIALLIRRKRYVAVGWLWYVGMLVPVIGLVQVGVQCLADRYTYIPLIGLFIIAAWAVSDVCQKRSVLRSVFGVTAMLLLAAMFAGTRNQLHYWRDSISLCRRAIQVTENNYIMHNNLGNALRENDQMDEAIIHLRRALQINPDYADAYYNLGLVLSETGQLNEAIIHYRRALQINPNNVKVHNNLGNAFVEVGQVNEAIVQYRRVLQINPDNADAHNNLGFVLSETGQLNEAIIHLRRALQINPDNADVLFNLGNALRQIDRSDEAIIHYRRALQINPNDVKVHNNLGNAFVEVGQWDEAIVQYRRILQIDPNDVKVHNNLGNALFEVGQWDEAIVQYRRVLQIDPNNVKVHNNLGNALFEVGQWDEAIIYLRRALQNNPDDARSHYRLGIMLADRGHPAEAIVHYRRLIKLQPEYPAGLNNLAWILATASDPMLRNPVEAIELAQKACELTDYQNPSMMDTLAAAYAGAGRIDKAVSTVEKALGLAQAKGYENLVLKLRENLKRFKEGQTDTGKSP